MYKYGICDCGKWGLIPAIFRENKHFLKCPNCGAKMYLFRTFNSIKELGFKTTDEVTITEVINHE
jgi:hypothetical protein